MDEGFVLKCDILRKVLMTPEGILKQSIFWDIIAVRRVFYKRTIYV